MGVFSALLGTRVPSVSPEEARDLLRDGAVLVDVRELSEWDAGHVRKARHVPLSSLASGVGRLPAGRRVVVACRSGNRSARATTQLRKAGVDAVNLAGGLAAWRAAGLPLVDNRGRGGKVA